ncbi:Uncharacterized protein QTN25_004410 [Entamoeba marina]
MSDTTDTTNVVPKETNDVAGSLNDILSVVNQKEKCDEVNASQKEIIDNIKDQLHHINNIQQLIQSKTKDFNQTIDQSIALVKDTKNDLLVIQAKIQFVSLLIEESN